MATLKDNKEPFHIIFHNNAEINKVCEMTPKTKQRRNISVKAIEAQSINF